MPYDISMTSDAQLLALINDDNSLNIAREQVAFGVPEAAQGVDPAGDTQISVSGVHNGGFKSSVVVVYDRIPMQDFIDHDAGPIQVEDLFDAQDELELSSVVAAWNAYYGSNLVQADDLDEAAFTVVDKATWEALVPGTSLPITLQAAAGSIAYIGSISLDIQRTDASLPTVVTVTDLNGLTFNLPA